MKKILVIQQKMIGDVLMSTVICQAIKTTWPDCTVHYMVYPNTAAVVEGHPDIDKIVLFDPAIKGFLNLARFGKSLAGEQYDAVVDAYGKWESILPMYFSGAKIRIGFYKWYTQFFYTKTVKPKADVHGSALHHRLQLAEALNGKFVAVEFPEIYLSPAERQQAKEQMQVLPKNPVIMVSVLGSAPNKSLPPQHMAQMLDDVAQQGNVTLLFNFIPSQAADAQKIYDLCKPETQRSIVLDFYMKGLRPFLAVLSHCDALIGNEGGAVNMAKALGIPTFTVYSPWIATASWNIMGNDQSHVAVHLMDYEPHWYQGHPKKLRQQAMELYQRLNPSLYRDKLQTFVNRIIS